MKSKNSLSRYIRVWGTVLIVGIAVSLTVLGVVQSYRDFHARSDHLQKDYIARQKDMIRQEVARVVELISFKKSQTEQLTREAIRSRTYEAFAVAQNIYDQNKASSSREQIAKMIIDALRPLRYADNKGYYFVTRLDGLVVLFADRPEMEKVNLIDVQDTRGKYVFRDMIDIAKEPGEGFYEYHWTKPQSQGNDFKKVSFVKLFEPLGWFIGTGLYVDDLEEQVQDDLLADISRIRFGTEGYIFVNRLNGDALVSNGKVFSGTKKLWEEFDADPQEMKRIFDKEFQAAMKPEGDYIYYSHIKLTSPDKVSPKTSYILGVPDLGWLVGAGVYLDDVDEEIALMQSALGREISEKLFLSLLVSLAIFVFFLILFDRLSRNLEKDTRLLVDFLQRASFSNETIDRDEVHFDELDRMAERANEMLADKAKAETALLASEKRFMDLVENSTDWIWEFDENEIFTYASPRVKDLLGYDPEELIGQSAFDPMTSEESARVWKEFLRYKEVQAPFANLINVNQHKNGRDVVIESSGIPVFDDEGHFRGYRGIDRDITKRTVLEEQLRQAHKMEAIGTLAGGIAHDFNNILSAIVGYAELAKLELGQSSTAYSFVDEVLKASLRARELVRHILSFSRKEPGKLAPVHIHIVVEEALKLLRATIPANIEIKTDIDPDCGQILANPTQLHQIVLNLCTNASHAMEEKGGRLQVVVSQVRFEDTFLVTMPERSELMPGPYVMLTVCDTGPGIDSQVLGKIFDPYFTTKDTGKGSGMGLAVVHGIVKSFGGVVEVESTGGEGACFHAYFPLLQKEQKNEIVGVEMVAEKAKGNERILLVDDEKDIVAINQKRLQLLGYEVTACQQADEALSLFRAQPEAFDLVITDQSMPKMNGDQLADAILQIRPSAKIVMCTGYSSRVDAEKAAKIGVKAFLMKPVDYSELAKVIRQVLDSAPV